MKNIYDDLLDYTSKETLFGNAVDILVDDGMMIKVYIRDEEGINGTFKKPLMSIHFIMPGVLTVKFILNNPSAYEYLFSGFKIMHIERNAYRVDFEKLEDFERFIGSL
ncbi:gp484 [Bacillus phage G]|uniref:Gp484 n=1 Tax=Bacillus phage G TaxID=2884420 RepID=G3MAM5_9CAUD|nr:gp484 [Bacillus phage G]AEO93742.1 gp484 [Bacillus phage G]